MPYLCMGHNCFKTQAQSLDLGFCGSRRSDYDGTVRAYDCRTTIVAQGGGLVDDMMKFGCKKICERLIYILIVRERKPRSAYSEILQKESTSDL